MQIQPRERNKKKEFDVRCWDDISRTARKHTRNDLYAFINSTNRPFARNQKFVEAAAFLGGAWYPSSVLWKGFGAVELLFFSCAESTPDRKPINPSLSSALFLFLRSRQNTNARAPRRIDPPTPTQTPMMVFRVLVDMPLDPLLLLPLSEASDVELDVDVLLDVMVEEMVLPSLVRTVTAVET